ncbi:response regulator transcription factor [Tamlana sp. 2_MG-2023]|uniref:response regulator n=1 Tax=unclassified Tamlana TaxID=2614803 RepID=UPI0026E3E92D|nr:MULTISPECIES: response regulator transcription factor [unclassified Tamlana]MDO6759890.1 response regulator transcription factor [Tamlana sp. 2_MG-2023]MDO6791940.1 response regulator transcription factor [Tamlana sp. 1_MG-2023]
MKTSITIADDHPLILRGLLDFLNQQGYKILASSDDGQTAYNHILKFKPEIAILDISMPVMTGLDVAELCHKNKLSTKIILLTLNIDEYFYNKALEYEVQGYILKEFALEQIEACIEELSQGKTYFSKEIDAYLDPDHIDNQPTEEMHNLTKSELKIVKLISKHKTSQQIAEHLSISVRTVDKHRSNIVNKLNLSNSPTSLVIWALVNKRLLFKIKD